MSIITEQNNQTFKSKAFFNEQLKQGSQIITKPIDTVDNMVNTTVDTFIPEDSVDEETKKSHKTAIRVGSTVFVLSALVPFLNPKFSSKMITKMKTLSAQYAAKAEKSDTISGKIYRSVDKFFGKGAQILNFANNWNAVKDEGFKYLCKKTKFLIKPHEWVTSAFDKISRQTVYGKYDKVKESFDTLDSAILHYKVKLPKSEAKKVDKLLEQAIRQQEYFSRKNITRRLQNQENLMSNLETDTVDQIMRFGKGFKKEGKLQHLDANLSFWADDIVMSKRDKIEADGLKTIQSMIGETEFGKGTYNKILEIIAPHIKQDDKAAFEEIIKNVSEKMNDANKTECVEYFNKKRDLILGSAPTDVLTQLIGLGLSGVAIGTADTKEDKISRSVTTVFPAVAGLGVSMAMATRLYSGLKGMLIGAVASGVLSITGSKIDKYFIRKNKPEEVKNA